MSYVQVEIEGKKYGLKYNQMALMLISEYTDEKNEAATAGYAVFYAGLKANAYVKREEMDLTFEQSCDLMEKLSDENVLKINEALNSILSFQKELPKEDTKKKKAKKSTITDA